MSNFVEREFLPQLRGLALCEGGILCRNPRADRMTFVDGHQPGFASHGFCARAESDPEFDRQCFSATGDSFDPDIVTAASQPMLCGRSAAEYRAYLPRARWIRDANDSYFSAMTCPQGLPTSQQPADIHDATWGVLSAVYGGAVHPSAEGHAAMADAAVPAAAAVLQLDAGVPEFTSCNHSHRADGNRADRIGRPSLCVVGAFFTLTFYDFFALRTIGKTHVPYRIAALSSFTSYTIGHNIGATVFTGGAIRFRIYSDYGLTAIDVAKICFLSGLTFWLGNLSVLGIGMVWHPEAATAMDLLPPAVNRLIGLGCLAGIAA